VTGAIRPRRRGSDDEFEETTATVQLTLFNFQSQFLARWNLLFAVVLPITIPPLVMFIFFQRQLASGLTAGAVKG